MAQFVNPYTFVPLGASVERHAPSGHAQLARGNLSGFLAITLTARTPLLIGGYGSKEKPELPRRASDEKVIIPGSGLMGAVRSLHETFVGGCMRVLDTGFVPAHRHPASTSVTRDLRLAVVSDVKNGQATRVALCDDWIWVSAWLLPWTDGEPPRTGDQLQYQPTPGTESPLPTDALSGVATRRLLRENSRDGIAPGSLAAIRRMGPVTEDCWVLLVTDTGARDSRRPVYFACGRMGPGRRSWDVPQKTWDAYLAAVAGADDLRPESLKHARVGDTEPPWDDPANPRYLKVWPPGSESPANAEKEPIGQRLPARTYLYEGQPVWVRVDPLNNAVTEIRLSQFWRYTAGPPVGERVGEATPCTDLNLCWSCRLFGSADTEGREEDEVAVQNSYRGHIRIDDLVAQGDVESLTWRLAPLASPKPSAGQFYLDNSAPGRQRLADRDTPAAATWGSVTDERAPRPIRGRKYYWRTEVKGPATGQYSRWKRRGHQSEKMSGDAALIPAGTVFRGRVAFDNISLADLGSLLVALDPRLLGRAGDADRARHGAASRQEPTAWDHVVTSVGGGKPFGFGAVRIDVGFGEDNDKKLTAQTAAERYLGAPPSPIDLASAVREFRAVVPSAARGTWPAALNALTFGYIPDELVWYPPGGEQKGTQDYDKSFEFFAISNGLRLAGEVRELVVLPDATAAPEHQVLESRGMPWKRGRRG